MKPVPVSYLNYDINEGRLSVAISAERQFQLLIKINRKGLFGSKKEQVIYDREIGAGKHTLDFNEQVLSGFAKNFLTVYINQQVYYMQRL